MNEAGFAVTPANQQLVVRAVDLVKTFPGVDRPLDILRGLNLTLRQGEMVAIVGQSGSGKSTLLHILGTLDRPTRGQVLIQGQDVFRFGNEELARFRRHSVGFVFQFHNLLPEFSALENVMMPARICGNQVDTREGQELLAMVGLSGRMHHRPGELSGGEKQRVAIARALLNNPKLILADEPTGNLDSDTGELVFELFCKIQSEKNLTSLLVTHNARIAARCQRTLKLESGVLQEINGGHV
ncbi:MAG: ABC transporter ATP-binding protein [Acidobacteriota bacterium]